MRLLAFDTSGPAISAVAVEAGAPVICRDEQLGRGHAERILPLLRAMLDEAGWSWRDVELVGVGTGPGNFTGIRAGIAVARSLVLTLRCQALALGSLEIVAESAIGQAEADRPIHAVLDAGRGEVYAQRFAADLRPTSDPAIMAAAELAGMCAPGSILVGSAAASLARAGDTVLPGTRDAGVLARLVNRRLAEGAAARRDGLHPVYVRPPDARRGAGASLIAGSA
ncbi:MAG: tRNA (adenosine(37)-N6)-threonylcarbamoyltransferase complex dimerization subunit type 1 TsaB [Geminicoccaceae bacterium]